MNGSAILDVAIGIVFLFAMLSLLGTTITELISRAFSLRSKNLKKGLESLLNDPDLKGLAGEVLKHPLIAGGVAGKKDNDAIHSDASSGAKPAKNLKAPSYISSKTFAKVLTDILIAKNKNAAKDDAAKDDAAKIRFNSLKGAIEKMGTDKVPGSNELKQVMLSLVGEAQSTIEDAEKQVAEWFDDSMDRISGWYKRNIQVCNLVVAALIVVCMNVSTVHVAQSLWTNETLRKTVVAAASKINCKVPTSGKPAKTGKKAKVDKTTTVVKTNETAPDQNACEKSLNSIKKTLQPLPLGWGVYRPDASTVWDWVWEIISLLFGWLITILAISLGAPFWFDLLNKLNSIRSTGRKPERGGK
jgi:hypothetical protein